MDKRIKNKIDIQFKDKRLILGNRQVPDKVYSTIKENVTTLVYLLLQDHQNDLKAIRDTLLKGRLDIVLNNLTKRLNDETSK